MDAKELRVGNNVLLLGNIVKIECISKLPMRNEMYWLKCDGYIDTKIIHFKPIPLTSSIIKRLLKFEPIEGTTYLFNEKFPVIYVTRKNKYISVIKRIASIETKIKYVHELQNLYFYLTGAELTINNP